MNRPTDAELAILRVLWDRGPSTVREVCDDLQAEHGEQRIGYTTVLKTMQIMTEKELLERDETHKAHVYTPRLPQEHTQKHLVGDLLDRAFDGSASKLVLRALSDRPASQEEIDEIRRLLDNLANDDKTGEPE
jgi:predicted transcriptional regulator